LFSTPWGICAFSGISAEIFAIRDSGRICAIPASAVTFAAKRRTLAKRARSRSRPETVVKGLAACARMVLFGDIRGLKHNL
jgi:hypothetical protein